MMSQIKSELSAVSQDTAVGLDPHYSQANLKATIQNLNKRGARVPIIAPWRPPLPIIPSLSHTIKPTTRSHKVKSIPQSDLQVAFINIRGLKNRLDRVNEYLVANPNVLVMIITETWLLPGEGSPRFQAAEAAVDARCPKLPGMSRGNGGIIILVRQGIKYKVHRIDPVVSIIETCDLRIAGCYFAPLTPANKPKEPLIKQEWSILEGEAMINKNLIILGDINAHGLQEEKTSNPRGNWLKALLKKSPLYRVQPTKGKWTTFTGDGRGINDHLFIPKVDNNIQCSLSIDEDNHMGGSDHRLLEVAVTIPEEIQQIHRYRYNLRHLQEYPRQFHDALQLQPPLAILEAATATATMWVNNHHHTTHNERQQLIDESWQAIKQWIEDALSRSCGKVKIQATSRKHFLTTKMNKVRIEWDQAIKLAQEATDLGQPGAVLKELWLRVGALSKWWTKRLQRRRAVVFSKVVDLLHTDPSGFQRMISRIKTKDTRSKGKCKLEAENMPTHSTHFSSTFGGYPTGQSIEVNEDILHQTDPRGDRIIHQVIRYKTSEEEMMKSIIKQLPNGKAAGLDDLAGEIWKLVGSKLESRAVLQTLFELCDTLSTTPTEWKISKIIPIYKNKGDELDIANYRPIALTQVIRRIYEQLLERMLAGVEQQLCSTQGGFRPNRSTYDQILILHEIICRFKHLCTIFLDIKAAYDTIDRRILWTRMAVEFNISLPIITRLRELFDSNEAFLVIQGTMSSGIKLLRGLLQGSSLSPLLFNIFINSLIVELHKQPKVSIGGLLLNNLFFADDVALLALNNFSANKLSSTAYSWAIRNGIEYALNKCKVVASKGSWKIKMNGVQLQQEDEYKYLGIYFNSNGIDFVKSTSDRAQSCLQMTRFMNSKGMNLRGWRLQQSISVYKSFLRPIMEYGLGLTILPSGVLNTLQLVQNEALRRILNGTKTTSVMALHVITSIPSIADRNQELNGRYFNILLNGSKKDLPVGHFFRSLYQEKASLYKRSLISLFKKSSKWSKEVYFNSMPPLQDIRRARLADLDKNQANSRDQTSKRLPPPTLQRYNHLLKHGWKLPRVILNELYSYKLNKIPRRACLVCGRSTSLMHLLICGEMKEALETIMKENNIDISESNLQERYILDKILWKLDTSKETPLHIYQQVGEQILVAKSKILLDQFKSNDEFDDDDNDPMDELNIQLQKKGKPKIQIRKAITDPRISKSTPHSNQPSHDIDQLLSKSDETLILQLDEIRYRVHDLRSISGSNWLNGESIDIYFRLLQRFSDARDTTKELFLGSDLMTSLRSGGDYNYSNIKRWLRRYNLGNYDRVYIPTNIRGNHWVLIILQPRLKQASYFDSKISMADSARHESMIRQLIQDEMCTKLSMTEDLILLEIQQWTWQTPYCIQQSNNNDCGVFVCSNAETFMLNISPIDPSLTDKRVSIMSCILNKEFIPLSE